MKYYYIIIFIICLVLTSCQTTQSADAPSSAEVKRVGECRLAVLGKFHNNNLLLVNKTNKRYLYGEQVHDSIDIDPNTLLYSAKQFNLKDNTSVTIVDDAVMAKMLSLLKEYNFFAFAKSCSLQDFQKNNWPEKESILLEKNGQCHLFQRPEHMVDIEKKLTEKGKTYRYLKNFIYQAQATGVPARLTTRKSEIESFQRNQNQLQQNLQQKRNQSFLHSPRN